MSRSRLPLILGGTAVAGVGYYLYNAGGSPKAAEKQFESTFAHFQDPLKAVSPQTKAI